MLSRPPLILIALLLACLAACQKTPDVADWKDAAKPDAQKSGTAAGNSFAGVTLDAEAQQRMGIELAPIATTVATTVARGTAVVLDGASLAATQADLDSARTEANSARGNLDRLQKLYDDGGNASRQAVDAARTQWAASRARLATAEARTRSDWGAEFVAAHGSGDRLMNEIVSGRAVLLRAEFSGPLPVAVDELQYSLLAADPNALDAITVQFVGRSRAPAQAGSGPSVILRATIATERGVDLRPGERLPVIAAARGGMSRPLVPAAAAFADGGQFWCYVARESGRFDRVPLSSTERVADGYPLSSGAAAGDRVVVRGAPLLLSLERGAGSVADEG